MEKLILNDEEMVTIINNKPEEMPEDMAVCFIGCRSDSCASCDGVCTWG
ncbi:ParLac system Cys-rich RiPP peptide [Lacrimispora amygdalina]|nr:ParLac system Cys-rich RiPP peptide [Lacrimispora amygdalina]